MSGYYKIVRDPLYGYVGLTQDEVRLVNTPIFQRLRRIKQLGDAHLVYPGACHTRFEHSIGVLHVAGQMADRLNLNPDETEIVRYAALLHDVGHGPMSHSFEAVINSVNKTSGHKQKVDHEYIGQQIIDNDADITEVIGDKRTQVIKLLAEKKDSPMKQIISGNVDADRLDYLRRDSYHIGVEYGHYDIDRILYTIKPVRKGSKSFFTIHEKGKDALENFRMARYLMYTQVYFHHVKLIAEKMMQRAVEIAVRDKIIDGDSLTFSNRRFIENYLSYDDYNLFYRIMSSDIKSTSKEIISKIMNRKLYKRGFDRSLINIEDSVLRYRISQMKENDFRRLEEALASKCGCDKDSIIVFIQQINNPLYNSTYQILKDNQLPVYISFNDKNIEYLSNISPFTMDSDPLDRFYVFCDGKHREDIKKYTLDVADEVLE
ncbi:HD domain-containing protein [Methanocella arvoryzae]|uniref:Metal-dependent phosphohydrolase (HD superfamily) n=1 Tax=Methanocella arvoryzae (strain DSM 22066 / NBRC 105507 / MRE50) TaxID=351160 RepID=Q0W5M9_METAR|nr:HD domain-containing protein [Methanocella arvoryzae]CAJ36314.1 putative metal-dependent phosphohydrolase (HD superfamily) [Methanocella arvoryzae MRE50]